MAKQNLVIVESPAKAKTIGKYLGKDFTVKASMGHLRDLPKSKLGVDLENDFEPDYKPIKGKEQVINDLKKSAKAADMVYLATDPDREGEAISWHLKQLLGLPGEKSCRVTFNEITKKVVQESIKAPRDIDQNLVDAQQARRILDRLVGYELSPLLWKKVKRGLSAGRVQSVATRMVDDRDREIEAFRPEEYWTLDARLKGEDTDPFLMHYKANRSELKDRASVEKVMAAAKPGPFVVTKIERSEKYRNPSKPFTTSTMQQEASRKLGMTPKRTMAIAQQLYEGVEIAGEGAVGLITYMRTDSVRTSEEANAAAQQLVGNRYGSRYAQARQYAAQSGAQDAHEAIRPTDVFRDPEDVKGSLNKDQYNLYRLIWQRFVASRMASAVYDVVAADVVSCGNCFHATASSVKFNGFMAVYVEGRDEDEQEEENSPLPSLQEGQVLALQEFLPEQHFTQPPAHYTEASLIREMEKNGIGRPSTYATTVSTIIDRNYVKKVGKVLHITGAGRTVTALLKDRFSSIADLKFTAEMESRLDTVESGETAWKDILREFQSDFAPRIETAEAEVKRGDYAIPVEYSDEICPECGKRLVIKNGKFGDFLGCEGFPECTFTMPVVEVMPGSCPQCGGRLMKRTGKSKSTGKPYNYYCCEYYSSKEDAKCRFVTFDVPTDHVCPECGQTMFKRGGKGNSKPFCINAECANFLPEDKRGYYQKKTASGEEKSAKAAAAKKPAAKTAKTAKAGAKKPAAKAKTAAKKKTTAKA